MSDVYMRRLRAIQREFNSAREAIRYIQRNWQKYNIQADLATLKPAHLDEANRNVEMTYFVRLYAEFEGVLKDHLATNQPKFKIAAKPKVDYLIRSVMKAEGLTLDPSLRRKMDQVHNYRNSVAHRAHASAPSVTFVDALSHLNTFLAKLPDPLV